MKEFTLILSIFGILFLVLGGVLAFAPAQGTSCQIIRCSGTIVYEESRQSTQLGTFYTTKSGPNQTGIAMILTGIGFFIGAFLHNRKPS